MSPFLEIGSNAGHSSYMLCNEFGEQGFALDLSADALRHGKVLMDRWQLDRAPIRIAGDGAKLPFRDESLRAVLTFQTLSQFMNLDAIFAEVKRVLQPGGIFLFAEEPIRRLLSLRLYRAPYEAQMKAWERKLHKWGLLGYLTKDVIGAAQEENFGIRQNHSMTLWDWDHLIRRHFPDHEYQLYIADRGWGESAVRKLGRRIDRNGSDWVPARLLGGTLAAVCRKAGFMQFPDGGPPLLETTFERLLRCPDCGGELHRGASELLQCASCGYASPDEDGVYNLLPSREKHELYPGVRGDLIDFCQDPCSDRLVSGFYDIEGVYGNKYRWIGPRAAFRLDRVHDSTSTVRIRGHINERSLDSGRTVRIAVKVNGVSAGTWQFDRPGLFILETQAVPAPSYQVELDVAPTFTAPPDERVFSINLSNMRLV
jgi:SAM-dependent methyltransferase